MSVSVLCDWDYLLITTLLQFPFNYNCEYWNVSQHGATLQTRNRPRAQLWRLFIGDIISIFQKYPVVFETGRLVIPHPQNLCTEH